MTNNAEGLYMDTGIIIMSGISTASRQTGRQL